MSATMIAWLPKLSAMASIILTFVGVDNVSFHNKSFPL